MALSRWKDRWLFLDMAREPKVLLLSLLSFLVGIGFAGGISSSNALLISRAGTESLFIVYFGSSLVTFAMAGLFYYLASRFAEDRVFAWSFEIFAVAILLLWWLLKDAPASHYPYYLARVLCFGIFIVTNLEFWLVTARFFTNFEAKLRYPLLVAANVLGIMAGGLLLDLYAARYGTVNFFPLWGGVLGLCPILLIPIRKKNIQIVAASSAPSKGSAPSGTRNLMGLLLFFWLAYTYLGYGVDYLFNKAALESFRDENVLAAFFGKVAFFSLAIVTAYQLFFAKYLSARLSVDRSVLLIALLFLVGILILAFSPSMATITFTEGLFYYFIDFAAVTLLMPVVNVFPLNMKGKVLIGIEGFGRPLGSLLLLTLALGLGWLGKESSFGHFLLGGTLLFLFYPFLFKKTYLHYLLNCLESEDRSLLSNAIQALGEPGHRKATPHLLAFMENTQEVALQKEIILALGRIRDPQALPRVISKFSASDESLQLAVIEALGLFKNYESLLALYRVLISGENVSFQVRSNATLLMTRILGKGMLPLLRRALQEEDLRVKANAIESIGLLREAQTISWILPYLDHENRRLRVNAAVALYPFRKTRAHALQVIDDLLRSKDPFEKFSGIYAVGELALSSYRDILVDLLKSTDHRLRRHVITALAKMRLPEYCELFVSLLLEADMEMAMTSIRNLGRFPESSRWKIFEYISRLPPQDIEKLLLRLDQSPLDFSKETTLLVSKTVLPGPRSL